MRRPLQERLHGEDGISLVEMLVAMVVLGVVLSAMASVLMTSVGAVAANERAVQADSVATEVLETMRALPWAAVTTYANDHTPAGCPAVNAAGQVAVCLAGSRPGGSRAPLPLENLVRGGVTYAVRRDIRWVDDPATVELQDYKRLVTTLNWSVGARAKTLTMETVRAPLPSEQAISAFVIRRHDVQPDVAHIFGDPAVPATLGRLDPSRNGGAAVLTYTLETTGTALFVSAQFTTRTGASATVNLTATDGRNWSATSNHSFANGDLPFTFTVTRPAGAGTMTVQKVVRFLQPVRITSAALTPSAACPADSPALTLNVHAEGTLGGDAVTVAYTNASGSPVTAPLTIGAATTSGSWWSATVAAGSYQRSTTFTVTANRLLDGNAHTASTSLGVLSCGP